jgi:hypothetical protein
LAGRVGDFYEILVLSKLNENQLYFLFSRLDFMLFVVKNCQKSIK